MKYTTSKLRRVRASDRVEKLKKRPSKMCSGTFCKIKEGQKILRKRKDRLASL